MKVLAFTGKGGSGKTTLTVSMAVSALAAGHSVGIIDTDPQRSSRLWHQQRGTLDIRLTACAPEDFLVPFRRAERIGFDWLMVDTPPRIDGSLADVLRVADFCLMPTRPALFDLDATTRTAELAQRLGRRFAMIINAASPRRAGRASPLVEDARRVLKRYGARVWAGQITHRHALIHALTVGRGVIETEPDGPAAAEYRSLWTSIDRAIVALDEAA